MKSSIALRVKFSVDDVSLSRLHAVAFGAPPGEVRPWASRLERHSLSWVGAFDRDSLVGFVHACWDGDLHAFLLDTVVDPEYQRRAVGTRLVRGLVEQVRAAGCEWLHVDYEPHLEAFYRTSCGFEPTQAGLIRLSRRPFASYGAPQPSR
jgi:GNAT superfamily N-acetyltransferase